MKKQSIYMLIMLMVPLCTMGQIKPTKDFNYQVSRPYRVVDAPSKYYFHKDGKILTVKVTGREITLQQLNAETLQFVKDDVFENLPAGFELEEILEFGDRYFLFYSVWDKPNETEQLFCQEIDFDNVSFKGKERLLLKVQGKIAGSPLGKIGYWNIGVTDKFDFQFSHDNSKLLVQYRSKPEKRNDAKNHDNIGLNVFDENVNLIWNKEVQMPYTEKKMNIIDYSIDSEGNTYILSTVYADNTTDDKKEKNGDPNYRIELFRIKANTSDLEITPIALEDKFVNNLWLYESPDNTMICAGFYNKGNKPGASNGVMVFKVGKDGDLYDKAFHEIPLDILNQYVSRKQERKNTKKEKKDKAEFEDLELRKLVIGDDGSLLLIGEQNYVVQHTYYANGTHHTTYSYHYNDMLVTKIDKDGKFEWMKKLPKRQTGARGQGGMSYEYVYDAKLDNHYVLFLDNVKNFSLPMNQVPAEHKDGAGGFLTAYKIHDPTGEVSKVYVLDTRDVNGMPIYQFYPRKIFPLKSGEIAFEAYKKKKEDIMIKVSLAD